MQLKTLHELGHAMELDNDGNSGDGVDLMTKIWHLSLTNYTSGS